MTQREKVSMTVSKEESSKGKRLTSPDRRVKGFKEAGTSCCNLSSAFFIRIKSVKIQYIIFIVKL